ncbi:MAG: carbon monoxide dehydrogenase [Actinobacteria bacterium]|nr:carbon monoxide dehydrogenase [Actinomycetota bacterium]
MNPTPEIKETVSKVTIHEWLNHVLARLGVNRSGWRVEPGLYRLGNPGPDSPVFVTANYQLSFDALRNAVKGIEGYILVLDTKGVNVWCAAGKGTFGTGELVSRIKDTGLSNVVNRHRVIVPQLGATGVAAHEVTEQTGFKVDYGPIRASDIPEFLRTGKATTGMRRVRFNLLDRLVLIPVELNQTFTRMLGIAAAAFFLDGKIAASGVAGAASAGLFGVPILLPWLPVKDYSNKGFLLGGAVGVATAAAALKDDNGRLAHKTLRALSYMLLLPPISAYISLNYTGVTPYASPSQVKREIYKYIPVMAGMAGAGIIMNTAQRILRLLKG